MEIPMPPFAPLSSGPSKRREIIAKMNTTTSSSSSNNNNKKVVLITDCAKGGIGYEYCKAFAALGCHVIATDLPDRLPNLASLPVDSVDLLPLDVTSDDSVTSAISQILLSHRRIDVLVNNAGVGSTSPLAEMGLGSIRWAFEVNTLGQLRMIQAVAPHMAARRAGRVLNIGSTVGRAATPWAGSYCATKAAVHAATDALRLELKPLGVHVIKVLPGAVRSNLGRSNLDRLAGREWRLYKGFEGAIEERARASQVAKATDAGIFARHVARKVMGPRPPREISFGHMAALFAVLAWSPIPVRDWFFAKSVSIFLMYEWVVSNLSSILGYKH